jgi:hypothetical protein
LSVSDCASADASSSVVDPDSIEKILLKKSDIFLIKKIAIYLSLKASLKGVQAKRQHPALKIMKFSNFFIFVGHSCPPGSGSRDLIEYGSYPDPDPQH